MARKLKCPECGTFNSKENTVYHNNKYYCEICYENKQKISDDYKALIEYICNLYEIEVPTGWILKQIKDYKEQFAYTYKGIKTSLHYFYEIQEGNSVEEGMGIGIVPFVYDEAKKFYVEKKAIKDNASECDLNALQKESNIITIKKSNMEDNTNKFKDVSIIDISQL